MSIIKHIFYLENAKNNYKPPTIKDIQKIIMREVAATDIKETNYNAISDQVWAAQRQVY